MSAATDRELLELAAKAAGVHFAGWTEETPVLEYGICGLTRYWNPLTDDGDALRLAVKLRMSVGQGYKMAYATTREYCEDDQGRDRVQCMENYNDHVDPFAATRRAIVRAAAEIGRRLP